ncbi:germ cell nuclear acidic protein-like [Ranitomeya variabilis]|uniref:germ cell nuclear acidic protein-like n=1 Tax=Ranitomeya variabilis TaxID=490064 RepID=UPI00405767AE
MMPRKRFKSIIDFSDIEDSSDDDDFSQSHPRKRPIPRSPGQVNIRGFNSGSTPSLPDLSLPPTDHGPDSTYCSDAIILIDDDDDFNRAGTSTYNNLILPTSDDPDSSTCSYYTANEDDDFNRAGTSSYTNLIFPTSDDPDSSTCSYYSTNEDADFNRAGTSSYDNKLPSDSEESSATEERTPLCNIPGCFLEDIISPTSIYVTNFQEKKEELVERLYDLYNRTVFNNKLPVKMDILWSKRLISAGGQCNQKLYKKRRYSVIELSEKVCDSVERVRDILVHEMCHAATWIIFGECNDNHGPLWQSVKRRVNRIHPELPEVTENHNYTINYNYNYKCSQCDKQIGRFRKIPDNKCYCRQCGGRLRQLSIS